MHKPSLQNRGRITVNPQGRWTRYASRLPQWAKPRGTITRDNGDSGALIELYGRYWQCNGNCVRGLPQIKVMAALSAAMARLAEAETPTEQPQEQERV